MPTQTASPSCAPAVLADRDAPLLKSGRSADGSAVASNSNILTVAIEDWFQTGSFRNVIDRSQWYRFDTRIEQNTHCTLDLLDRYETKATFFVLGWVAERLPDLIAEVAERGHEIASRGYFHRSLDDFAPDEFKHELQRTREVLEQASGRRILGYRVADGWMKPSNLWALEVLAEQGYAYDSSLCPVFRSFAGEPHRHAVHEHATPAGPIHEVPPSTMSLCGLRIPISGGNWFRQLPHTFLKHAVDSWMRRGDAPYVMYFHVWELDPEQPRVSAINRNTKLRHYRNLDKMRWVLEDYLARYPLGTVAESLGLKLEKSAPTDPPSEPMHFPPAIERVPPSSLSSCLSAAHCPSASIVIPCFNEESTLPYLARTLERLRFELAETCRPQFLFVDDCSTDATWDTMHAVFGDQGDCTLLRHEKNQGVSAAIRTGIQAADTEIVCSMDCDCSYDPLELRRMIPLLEDGVDLVTASPYHPEGHVKNVPGWRLFLSKGLSTLYRLILPQKLHTWTSCFRVYRKSAVEHLPLEENGFLGTAELVGRLSQRGSKIVEHPATLEVRIFGESKMKTCRTIVGHLRLIARLMRSKKTLDLKTQTTTFIQETTEDQDD